MSHTTDTDGGTSFIHNGDYSGDVTIRTGTYEIEVPFEDLREFVFGYLRGRMIEELESASDDTFERALIKSTAARQAGAPDRDVAGDAGA